MSPEATSSHPATIGRYQVLGPLGRGGMGEVFLARDPVLEREVAVKLIHGDLETPTSKERLVREARAAGRLRHPNIVTIFDAGEHDGRPFIAMEFVKGETLGNLIRRRTPLTLVQRLELMEGACAGLAHAHRSGVVHLDIKPDNLMLDESGIVKVLDFGIARVLQSGLLVTRQLGGTLRYMSPEQIDNRPLDHRSDIFSLGCALFEVITFVPAFVGSTKDIVSQISSGPVPALVDALPALDARLDAIVQKALALDPTQRYSTLDELGAELAAVRKRLAPDYDPRVGALGGGLDDIPTMSSDRRIVPESSFLRRMSTSTRRSTIAAVGFTTVLLVMSLIWIFGRTAPAPAPVVDQNAAPVTAPASEPPPFTPPAATTATAPAPVETRDSVRRTPPIESGGAAQTRVTPTPTPDAAQRPAPSPEPPAPVAPPVSEAPAPVATVVPNLPSTSGPAPIPEPPQVRARVDEDAIRETLRRYAAAYRSLDVDRILQVYPSLAPQAVELRRTFAGVTQYDIDIRNPQIDVQGDAAVVRATLARRITPRVGSPFANEGQTEFRLRRDGNSWSIVAVAAR
jgi:serine/threonine protein kinase/ketosteroid isomerase-like protein